MISSIFFWRYAKGIDDNGLIVVILCSLVVLILIYGIDFLYKRFKKRA